MAKTAQISQFATTAHRCQPSDFASDSMIRTARPKEPSSRACSDVLRSRPGRVVGSVLRVRLAARPYVDSAARPHFQLSRKKPLRQGKAGDYCSESGTNEGD
jgi:hypothetical protein